ncbi:MAG: hypothetical protein CR993_05880 [Rhodobacterales bacterium]|nr:MAG: hypothetical protein CR993_05880 [Rhodobacterales bacterium]
MDKTRVKSRIVGALEPCEFLSWLNPPDLVSRPTETPFFNGAKVAYLWQFNDCENLTVEAGDRALERFFNFDAGLKKEMAQKAYQNWLDYNEMVGLLEAIEVYQEEEDRPDWMEKSLQRLLPLRNLNTPDDVWEHISPTEVVITMDLWSAEPDIYLQILCDCTWEEEHGIQFILKNGSKLTRVSEQDGDLSD